MKPIIAATGRVHADSVVTLKNVEPASLVKIMTETGRSVIMSAESVFAFETLNGAIGVRTTLPGTPAEPSLLGWLSGGVGFDPDPQDSGAEDPRAWFVAGLVFGGGFYTGSRSRPARFTLPNVSGRCDALADALQSMIRRYGADHKLLRGDNQPLRISRKDTWAGTEIASHIVDQMLIGACRDALTPTTMTVDPARFPDFQAVRGFFGGLLATMTPTVEGLRFIHRDSGVIRVLNDLAHRRLGLPTVPRIHPHEPEVSNHRGTGHPHMLVLLHEHLPFAESAGITLGGSPRPPMPPGYFARVARIEPVGFGEAVEVRCDTAFTVDGIVLNPEFEVAAEVLNLATMQELFASVTDRAAVLANAHPHRTHIYGAL